MSVPEAFTNRSGPARPRLPEIALIGSTSNFSGTLVRAMSDHFPDLSLIQCGSVVEFLELPSATVRWLRLMLIDDITFANAAESALADLTCQPSTTVALAFTDADVAASIYAAHGRVPAIRSFLPLNVRLDVWLSLVRLLLHGGRYIPEELLTRHQAARDHDRGRETAARAVKCERISGLTERQYKVLELVAAGLPNKVIATRLGVSDHTVKLHIHNIISKLGVNNRTEAAARFYDGPQ